jgi:hypothetical protein
VATVEDSALRVEMGALDSQEEDVPECILWYNRAFSGVIRSHRRDEAWSASLWQSFFATCVGGKNFFRFGGGLSRCFTVPYPWQGSQVIITPEEF